MEIIKHGKCYEEPHEKVCPACECVFTYVNRDIKRNWVKEIAYINCPECGNSIIIKDFRK